MKTAIFNILVISLLLINVGALYRRSLIRRLTPHTHPVLAPMVNPALMPRICYIQRVPVYIPVPMESMAPVRRTSQTIVSRGRFWDRLPKLAARKNIQPKVEQRNPVQPNISLTTAKPPTYIIQKKVDEDEDDEAAKDSKIPIKQNMVQMSVYNQIYNGNNDDDDLGHGNVKQERDRYVKDLSYNNENAKELGYEMLPVINNNNYDNGRDRTRGDSSGNNPVPQTSYQMHNILPNVITQRVLSNIKAVNDNNLNKQYLSDNISWIDDDNDKSDSVENESDRVEDSDDKSDSVEEDDNKSDSVENESDRVEDSNDKRDSVEDSDDRSDSIEDGDDRSDSIEESDDKSDSEMESGDKSDSIKDHDDTSDSIEDHDDKSDSIDEVDGKSVKSEGGENKSESIEERDDTIDSLEDGDDESDSREDDYKTDSLEDHDDKSESGEAGLDKSESGEKGDDKTDVREEDDDKSDSGVEDGDKSDSGEEANDESDSVEDGDKTGSEDDEDIKSENSNDRLINILKPINVNNRINSNLLNRIILGQDSFDTDDIEISDTFKRPIINILRTPPYRGIVLGNNQNEQQDQNTRANGNFVYSTDNVINGTGRNNVIRGDGKGDNVLSGNPRESDSRDNVHVEKFEDNIVQKVDDSRDKVKNYPRNNLKESDERNNMSNVSKVGTHNERDNTNSRDVKIVNPTDDSLPARNVNSKHFRILLTHSQLEELMKNFNSMNKNINTDGTIQRRKQVGIGENERLDENLNKYSETDFFNNNFDKYPNLYNEEGFDLDLSYDQRKPDTKVNNVGPTKGLKSPPTTFMDIKNKNMKTIGISYILPLEQSTNTNTRDTTIQLNAQETNAVEERTKFLNLASPLLTAPTVEIPDVNPTQLRYSTTSATNVLPSVPTRMVQNSTYDNTHRGEGSP